MKGKDPHDDEWVSIRVERPTFQILQILGEFGDTANDLITKLLDLDDERLRSLNTKKEGKEDG